MDRRDGLHHAEMARRDEAHQSAMTQRDDAHEHEMELLRAALASRDLIGQAKGVIIAALGCTPDAAFEMLRAQSMHENRKLAQVAQTVVDQAIRARQSRPPHSTTLQ
jgi:AmiR/NasT family two-component response regulator